MSQHDAGNGDGRVSVVVATYNRPHELDRLLAGLAEQEVAPYEVIIVDDGSATPAAPTFPDHPTIQWCLERQTNAGPGAARHAGVLAACGEIIIIIDDDMVVTPRLVGSHIAKHAAGFEVVQGRFENSDPADRPLFDSFVAAQQSEYFERCAENPEEIAPVRLSTGNVSFRRDLYLEVGGFDLSLRRREDSELGVRFDAAGARFGFAAEHTAFHDEPVESLSRWLQVAHEYGAAQVPIAQRHPDTYQPWHLLDEIPTMARLLITTTMRWPALMGALAAGAGACGQVFEWLRLRRVGVKVYGLAYALSWFAGTAEAFGPSEARRSLALHRAVSVG